MVFLREIITLFDTYKKGKKSSTGKNKSNYELFFTGIKNEVFQTDEEAKAYFIKQGESPAHYRKLKSRFKQKLIDRLFLIEYKSKAYSDIQKAYFRCHKNWVAVRILFGKGMRDSAYYLAVKTLKKALYFEFTEIVLDLSRLLRLYAATMKGSQKEFAYYDQLVSDHFLILEKVLLAESLYEKIVLPYALSKSDKKDTMLLAKKFSEQLKKVDLKIETHSFTIFAYFVHNVRYEISHDPVNLIKSCDTAVQKLRAKPFNLRNQIGSFMLRKFSAHLQLAQYSEARAAGIECDQIITKDSINWFTAKQYQLIYLIYTEQFAQIPKDFYPVLKNSELAFRGAGLQETYKLIHAYLYLLTLIGKIPKDAKHPLPRFRLGKFLNETPVFSKDKRGFNIDILVLQIMIALARKNYNYIIDRQNSLKRYSSRYLKKNEHYRSNCFVNILLHLVKAEFHQVRFLRYAAADLKKLKAMPLEAANQISDFEIVPYEYLLSVVLELCD